MQVQLQCKLCYVWWITNLFNKRKSRRIQILKGSTSWEAGMIINYQRKITNLERILGSMRFRSTKRGRLFAFIELSDCSKLLLLYRIHFCICSCYRMDSDNQIWRIGTRNTRKKTQICVTMVFLNVRLS